MRARLAQPEEIEIEVWWPKDTGPFRHSQDKKHKKPHHRRDKPQEAAKPDGDGAQKPDGDGAQKPERHKRDRPHRKPDRAAAKQERPERPPRKPERPIDPDSPFAVLGALKAQFGGKSS